MDCRHKRINYEKTRPQDRENYDREGLIYLTVTHSFRKGSDMEIDSNPEPSPQAAFGNLRHA